MARQQPIELFMPPNMLKAKVGGGLGGIDMAALKRAEAAMEDLKTEFGDWIAGDIQSLAQARSAHAAAPGPETRAGLMRAAHDLKGQAPTFDFPLVARIAGSLARLLDELPPAADIPLALVDAHVNAVQAIHRQGLKETGDRTAQALCTALDAQVDALLAKSAR